MMASLTEIRADFDRIAVLEERAYDNSAWYYPYLLSHVPTPCQAALDVGCGTGNFVCELAARAHHVAGIDLSPTMIEIARMRAEGLANATFHVADVMHWPIPPAKYDCIASVATLHHLPMEEVLPRLVEGLRPGGVLLVLDLLASAGLGDRLRSLPAAAASAWLRWRKTGQLWHDPEVRAAWEAHARHDVYPTMRQVQIVAERHLPGACVRRHLLWRYSVVWRKPERCVT
jgi:SAM-dependent methyltransferase